MVKDYANNRPNQRPSNRKQTVLITVIVIAFAMLVPLIAFYVRYSHHHHAMSQSKAAPSTLKNTSNKQSPVVKHAAGDKFEKNQNQANTIPTPQFDFYTVLQKK